MCIIPNINSTAPPPRQAASDNVAAHIKQLLMEQKLRPGDRLPSEGELAQQLSVSRSSVREGMKKLSALGLIEIRRGDGTYISTELGESLMEPFLLSLMLTHHQLPDMVELREIIEPSVARLALIHADDTDLAAIHTQLCRMDEAIQSGAPRDCAAWAQLDLAFHNALGHATHNILVQKIYAFTLRFFALPIQKTYEQGRNPQSAQDLHTEIYQALATRNEAALSSAVARSIEEWANRYKQLEGEELS